MLRASRTAFTQVRLFKRHLSESALANLLQLKWAVAGVSSDSSSWHGPGHREMCQAVYNACPGILESPKAVANTAVVLVEVPSVTRASKCGIADFGAGIGIGYGIRVVIVSIVITIAAVFQGLFFALGRVLKGISVNDKFACKTSLYLIIMSLPGGVRQSLRLSPNSRNIS
jgi:hypothetical protein